MRVKILSFFILVAILLASCQSQTAPPTTVATTEKTTALSPTSKASPVPQKTEASTAAPTVNATEASAAAPTVNGMQAPAQCTVVTQPTPDPTVQSLFPAISDQDWVSGPETAEVTFIEYSDFQ